MGLRLITAPVSEPVSLAEAKAHLRIDQSVTVDDTEIQAMITAARTYIESVCWRALMTQTWEIVLDNFPCSWPSPLPGCGSDHAWLCSSAQSAYPKKSEIPLPLGTIQSITSVKYDDANGTEQTFASSNYVFDETVPPRLVLKTNSSWPTTSGEANCIRIRFVAGYAGSGASIIPQPLKSAILLLVSQLYEHRTPEVVGAAVHPIQFSLDALISSYRLQGV
jgi:uncharacterized phiE125 gp8 family phage protein